MKVLALEPYYGGSHQAFLDGWSGCSRHDWSLLSLPPFKWKWRMRHAAVTFAEQVARRVADGETWDLLFCSDMLNLAEFSGLAPAAIQQVPSIVYFHENQLTYPVRQESERDYHFVLANMVSALAATQVWFNSAFHRGSLLQALSEFLKRMPDHHPLKAVERIREKSSIHPPGIVDLPPRGKRGNGPIRILWAARWEHDKNPETFFEALRILKSRQVEFRLSVMGEQFRYQPPAFEQARVYFADSIDRWGYQKSRSSYEAALHEADVFVSTANHEFFGISAVEAVAAGAFPVLPRRLSYPEIFSNEEFFYDGSAAGLAHKLGKLAQRVGGDDLWQSEQASVIKEMDRFRWIRLAVDYDESLERIVQTFHKA